VPDDNQPLGLGHRCEVNCYDGRGGDCWIPGSVSGFEDPPMDREKSGRVVVMLDWPDPTGQTEVSVPLPGRPHRIRREFSGG
jgi:hypothetical protein